jgi:hypothetical protein
LLLEALQAVDRSSFYGLERHFRVGSTLSTNSSKHLAWCSGTTVITSVLSAILATLGFIFETLLLIEFLLTNGEYELLATILTH